MTDAEKTLVQNWAYWLEHFCESRCFGREGACSMCPIPNIVKQMKEEVEGPR
jgi:hypothetical protein